MAKYFSHTTHGTAAHTHTPRGHATPWPNARKQQEISGEMKRVLIILFLISFSTAFAGMELVNIVDWCGPCNVATRPTDSNSEWVIGTFSAGIQVYLINSSTHAKIDSARIVHEILPLGLPVAADWYGDTLFAVYKDMTFIYDLTDPLSPVFIDTLNLSEADVDRYTRGDSAVYILVEDTVVSVLDIDSLDSGISHEIARWFFCDYINIFAEKNRLYLTTDSIFLVIANIDSIPSIVYADSLFSDYSVVARGDTVLLAYQIPTTATGNILLYEWISDTLTGPVLTSHLEIYLDYNLFLGRSTNEFWGNNFGQIEKISIISDSINIEIIDGCLALPHDFKCSNENLYISSEWGDIVTPAIGVFSDIDGSFKTLLPNNIPSRIKPLPCGDIIGGGNPLRRYSLADPQSPVVTSEVRYPNLTPLFTVPHILQVEVIRDTAITFWYSDSGVVLFDISSPDTFIRIEPSNWVIEHQWQRFSVFDTLAYIYCPGGLIFGSNPLNIYSYDPLSNLTEITEYDFPGSYYGSCLIDNYFIHEPYVYDYSNPFSPTIIESTLNVRCHADNILRLEDLYFFENTTHVGITVLRIDTSGVSVEADSLWAGMAMSNACIYDSILFTTVWDSLKAYRIPPDLDFLSYLGSVYLPRYYYNMVGVGDYLYAPTNYGLAVVDISDLTAIRETDTNPALPEESEISVYPNPFNSACTIHGPELEEISIMSIDGRVIEKVTLDATGFGQWNPREECATGIYLFKSKSSIKTAKAVYIK